MNAILNTSKVGRVGKAGFALALGLLIGVVAAVLSLAEQVDRSQTPDGILEALEAQAAVSFELVDRSQTPDGILEAQAIQAQTAAATASESIQLKFVAQASASGFEVNLTIKSAKPLFLFLEQEILASIVQAAAANEAGFERLEAQSRQANAAAFTLYFASEIPLDPLKARLAKILANLANRPVFVP